MRSLFNYDSKFMQILMTIADIALLNILFILCSLPIVTIGAAQAGLFSGIRQLMNKEDDSSCFPFFFKGFANGFWKITVVHIGLLIIMALLGINTAAVLLFHYTGAHAPVWMCVAALIICAVFHTTITVFHAGFDCTVWQLLKNSFFMILAHPLRAIGSTILVWLPAVIAIVDLFTLLHGAPMWILLYYGVAFLFVFSMWKKPFANLKENFLAAQAGTDTSTEIPCETSDAAEESAESL